MTCALLLIGAAGCGGDDQAARPPSTDATPSEPRPGGELIVAIQSDGKSLDPHVVTDAGSMRLIENMYDTLMRYAADYGDVSPGLAESHAVSDDGLTYTFTLQDGATFHSGRTVTADDVVYSLQRIIHKKVRAQHLAAVESVEAPDERTVVLKLARPDAPLLTHLAYPMNAIVDREVVDANDDSLANADAGSGPFKLVAWRKDHEFVMERHDAYHVPDRPYLDRVVFRPIPDETARTTAIRTGQAHLVLDVPAKDISIMDKASDVVVESVPGTFWEYVGVNCEREPFDDPRVRQAVAWAIDRQRINTLVKFGHAMVLDGGHIPPTHWAHADLHIYPQRDVAKAKALLAEADHADGFSVTLKVGSSFPYQVRAAEVVKQQLADVGIDVKLQAMESTVFFADLGRSEFDMTLVGWVGFVDPDEWTYNLFHSQGKYNQQRYANAELDTLLERGRRTLDREQRINIYRDAQRIIATDAPVAFLYVSPQTSARRPDVQGYVVHPTATTLWLRDTWIAR